MGRGCLDRSRGSRRSRSHSGCRRSRRSRLLHRRYGSGDGLGNRLGGLGHHDCGGLFRHRCRSRSDRSRSDRRGNSGLRSRRNGCRLRGRRGASLDRSTLGRCGRRRPLRRNGAGCRRCNLGRRGLGRSCGTHGRGNRGSDGRLRGRHHAALHLLDDYLFGTAVGEALSHGALLHRSLQRQGRFWAHAQSFLANVVRFTHQSFVLRAVSVPQTCERRSRSSASVSLNPR